MQGEPVVHVIGLFGGKRRKARAPARRGGRLFHRGEHWASAVESRKGRSIPAQAIGRIKKHDPFQWVSPEGATEWLALSGLAAVSLLDSQGVALG